MGHDKNKRLLPVMSQCILDKKTEPANLYKSFTHTMRKAIMAGCLGLLAWPLAAQQAMLQGISYFGITPKELTSGNKPVLYTEDKSQEGTIVFTLYDENFMVSKKIQCSLPKDSYRKYRREGTIIDPQKGYTNDNVDWKPGVLVEEEGEDYWQLDYADFWNFDAGTGSDRSVKLTQTLFNNDDKWEYVVPTFETQTSYEEGMDVLGEENGKALVAGYYYETDVRTGSKVVSEDGQTLFTLTGELNIYLMLNGKRCVVTYTYGRGNDESILYEINSESTGLTKVAEQRGAMRVRPSVIGRNSTLTIQLGETDRDGELSITNANGQLIRQTKVEKGTDQVELNSGNLPQGLYQVTLRQQGHTKGSHKFIVR